jgi:tetratricopeptide (TPR) repeat protein
MTRIILTLILLLAGSTAMAAGSGGGGGGASMPSAVSKTPEQIAAGHYKSGLRYKKRAWKQEEKAATAKTPEKRDKLLAKAAKNYEKALNKYVETLRADRQHHEAANELGYSLRRAGRYEQAIQWYDRALELKPGFLEAIEYRGEAYLAVGNVDAAKGAYMELFRNDQALADQLLVAMEAWLSQQASGSVESTDFDGFSEWLTERRELAGITRDVSLIQSRQW